MSCKIKVTSVFLRKLKRLEKKYKSIKSDVLRLGENLVATPGDASAASLTEAVNAPCWLENGAASLHVFSESELYFILAEAKARLGLDAKTDFENGIKIVTSSSFVYK